MTLLIIALLNALALVFVSFRKTKLAITSIGLSLVAIFVCGSSWGVVEILQATRPPARLIAPAFKESNLIIVLGGGLMRWPTPETAINENQTGLDFTANLWTGARTREAARLYYACKQGEGVERTCRILATGGDPRKRGITEAAVMKRELEEIGISATDILIEPDSRNTFENARFSSHLFKRDDYKAVFLVTSSTHMKRAQTFFRHFGIAATSAPSDYIFLAEGAKPTAIEAGQFDLVLHEHLGIVQYHIYNTIGRNPPPIAIVETKED